ncbi:MAG: 4-hydroxy-tetrahydrodipicolinate synthase [Dehalococcoidia bacterium]|nr:4-hydroxy-tetrahydrodipicolinate synthase [Dehalococcoidia bacterium]
MPDIGRVITAMVTPFREDGAVDYEGAGQLALQLVGSGTESLVIAGTTGESPTLSHAEKLDLFAAVKDAVGDRAAVVAGTGNYDTRESAELTAAAERSADAFLLTVPYYNKPPQEGLYQHFKAIAAVTVKPCVLYNVPSRTALNMTAETTIRLSDIENIAGVKEASGDLSQVSKVIAGARAGFRVWSGNDEDTFGIVSLGGYGVVGVITHLVANQVGEMIDLLRGGRSEQAAVIHRRLLPLRDAMFSVTSPIPIKWTLRRLGARVGPLRLPLVDLDQAAADRIWAEVEKHALDLQVRRPVKVS